MKVTSPDGTGIPFHRTSAGPPLILVHGSGAANALAWTAVMPGQQHVAMYTAPDLVVHEIVTFVTESD